jgi:cell filamentation protein
VGDPYVYPGTNILRNRLNIRDQHILDLVELRAAQAGIFILKGRPLTTPVGVDRLKATHKAIFGEIYEWAGQFRENTGSMQKYRPAGYPVVYGPSMYIPQEIDRIFAELKVEKNLCGLTSDAFAERAAFFYGEMDGTHPFREGNSRTLRQFFSDLARQAGYELDWSEIAQTEASREALYRARDEAAMQRKPQALKALILKCLRPRAD